MLGCFVIVEFEYDIACRVRWSGRTGSL